MRFIAGGPVLPDSLLEERDAGRVVFLCGAGVSRPAGMPDFVGLARYVIEAVDPPHDSEVRRLFGPWSDPIPTARAAAGVPLDQIFHVLQQDYGREQIDDLVSKKLAVAAPESVIATDHEVVARISADQEGKAQIVTTNFDRLFEYALGTKVRIYTPPSYPDLRYGVPVTGITYLHGRVADAGTDTHGYVLSSADFGRAYLAEGWATAFMRQLLQRYTVVLLGYRAEDPPVRYLLQGLDRGRDQTSSRLFAFGEGAPDEIEAKWRDRGVTPIAYGDSHQALWDTLGAWADRADNPDAWRTGVVELSRQGPRALAPHERGMVAHLVRTSVGARQFADATPAPPVEWLCVFDRNCRFTKASSSYRDDNERFDLLKAYGLDDDPPRPSADGPEDDRQPEDLISWRQGDDSVDHWQRLSSASTPHFEPVPSRLWHLTRWILLHLNEPILAWWVARQPALHPRLREMLKRAVEDSDEITDDARQLWMILVEALQDGRADESIDMVWFQVQQRIKTSGWTGSVVRAFEAATEPGFKVTTPYGLPAAKPPSGDWSGVKWHEVADIDVRFPDQHGDRPDIPDTALPLVYAALERNLIRASERFEEVEKIRFRLATFYPQDGGGADRHVSDHDAYVHWFLELLDRMATVDPGMLRRHIGIWPESERHIFDKLRLYIWNKRDLFSGDEIAERMLALRSDQFWRDDNKRELMFLLRDRWPDLSFDHRNRIAERILHGPSRWEQEDDDEYRVRRSTTSAMRFGRLLNAGCACPEPLVAQWKELKSRLPEWQDGSIDDAARANEVWSGWVTTNEDASVLHNVPPGRIIQVATENSRRAIAEFTEYKPFLGLVKNRPARALAALAAEARRRKYPAEFWRTAISNWPDDAPARATRLLHERMRRLPHSQMHELRWAIGDWLRNRFPKVAEDDEAFAYAVFDDLVEGLLSIGPDATRSSLGTITIGGEVVQDSRRTIQYAVNGPIGHATEGVLAILRNENHEQGAGLPRSCTTRVERLLAAPGEGSDHAVCLLAAQIGWLNYVDPAWVTRTLIPKFNLDHPASEPAWNGILQNNWMLVRPIFDQIKESFLLLRTRMRSWAWRGEAERYYAWIVQSVVFATEEQPGISSGEARDCLRRIDQHGLRHVLWFLGRVGAGNDSGWKDMVVPFIRNVWPLERRYRTAITSQAWLNLLNNTGDSFPLVLEAVREHLLPNSLRHTGLHRFRHNNMEQKPIATRFPRQTLDLLDLVIPDDPRSAPYDLAAVLALLADADPSVIADRRYDRLRRLAAGG